MHSFQKYMQVQQGALIRFAGSNARVRWGMGQRDWEPDVLVDSTLIDVLKSSQLLPLFWKRKTRSSLALVEKRLRARMPCSSSSLPCALSSPSNYLIASDAAENVRLQRKSL
jgi:hypothetical protein